MVVVWCVKYHKNHCIGIWKNFQQIGMNWKPRVVMMPTLASLVALENLQCHQQWQSWHHGSSWFSMLLLKLTSEMGSGIHYNQSISISIHDIWYPYTGKECQYQLNCLTSKTHDHNTCKHDSLHKYGEQAWKAFNFLLFPKFSHHQNRAKIHIA